VEGASVPDFDAIEEDGVVTQFNFQGTQGEGDFEEFPAQRDGAVFAHSVWRLTLLRGDRVS